MMRIAAALVVLGGLGCATRSREVSDIAHDAAPVMVAIEVAAPASGPTTFVDDPALALTVAARVKTGVLPKSVALSPDGSRLWVCNFGSSGQRNVYVYDSTTLERVGKVHFSGNAVEIGFAHSGAIAYVSNFSRGVIEVVDTETYEVVHEVKRVGRYPKVIAVAADDAFVYVANWGSGDVAVIDAHTLRVVDRYPAGRRPRGMALGGDGTLFVDSMWDHVVHVYAPEHSSLTITSERTIPTCRYPRHAALGPDDAALFVTCSGDDRLRWHDPDDGRMLGEAPVGDNPRSFALSDDGRWSAVANFDDSSVSVVDLVGGRYHTTAVPDSDRIVGLAVAQGSPLRVFVTSWGDNQLVELRLAGPDGSA